ncbi:MAG: hypothetical protein ACLTXP_15035 [Odoribacter splanchnicus]
MQRLHPLAGRRQYQSVWKTDGVSTPDLCALRLLLTPEAADSKNIRQPLFGSGHRGIGSAVARSRVARTMYGNKYRWLM